MYHTRKDKTFNESSTSDLFQKCDRKNRLHHDKRLYVPRRPAGLLSSIRSNLARQLTTGPLFSISRFPAHPEFYATSKMINVKKHYIYNDNFTLHVSDLNQIHLATDEDKAYGIDHWAKLFKAKTWEDLKMLATDNNTDTDMLEATCETIFRLNQDDAIRYWCEAREDGERILRTYKNQLAEKDKELAIKNNELAEKDARIASLEAQLRQK